MADDYTRASQTDEFANIARGLGTERYKEYDIAPYVEMVQVTVPEEAWSSVFYSWQSMKGFLQAMHQLERVEMFAARETDGSIFACFMTIWSSGDSMAEWLQNGYPIEQMLTGLGVPEENIQMRLIRDYT